MLRIDCYTNQFSQQICIRYSLRPQTTIRLILSLVLFIMLTDISTKYSQQWYTDKSTQESNSQQFWDQIAHPKTKWVQIILPTMEHPNLIESSEISNIFPPSRCPCGFGPSTHWYYVIRCLFLSLSLRLL